VCSRRIGPADAMVIAVAVVHKTQLLASIYRTFYLAKVVTFETRNGPSTHVIDATSFVKTCQQEKNVDSGQKFENLLSSYEAQKKVVADMRP
jgi:hypothetical protein